MAKLRMLPLALAALLALFTVPAAAQTQIRLYGDFRAHGTFIENQNFTGWNATGTQTQDTFALWQRLRLHADLDNGENLGFRLGLWVNNQTWGTGYLTAANPAPAIVPNQAYLRFTVPDTAVTVTAGYQPVSLPHTPLFYDSIILSSDSGNIDTAALIVSAPLVSDVLTASLGYARLVDTNRTYDTTTTQVGDEFDLGLATAALTLPGLALNPYGAAGIIGKNATLPGSMNNTMRSAGSFLSPAGYADNQVPALWAGTAVTVDRFDPIRLYADVAYGDAGFGDRSRNRRQGWFADVALEYTGFSVFTPQLMGWWGSGEDASLGNGSERLPTIVTAWGPAGSFLFNANQDLTMASLNTTPQGSLGVTLNVNAISVIPKLTSLAAVSYATGTNSPAGLRRAVAATGGAGQYVTMGQDLAQGESLFSVASEHVYSLYDSLDLIGETGFAQAYGLRQSVWGRRMVRAAGDAWQGALGLRYRF
jgi:hypothetical protein